MLSVNQKQLRLAKTSKASLSISIDSENASRTIPLTLPSTANRLNLYEQAVATKKSDRSILLNLLLVEKQG